MGLIAWLRSLFSPPPEERRRLLLDPALLDVPQQQPEGTLEHCPPPHEGQDDAAPSWDDPAPCDE